MDRVVARGVLWTGAFRWFGQLLSWSSTLVLVRLLTPADYGLAGMATAVYAWVSVLGEFGLTSAIMTHRTMELQEQRELHSTAMLVGVVVALATALAAAPLGIFYRQPVVPWFMLALAGCVLFDAARIVPTALLQRELSFRAAASVDFAKSIGQTGTVLATAAMGWGAWALIAGMVVGSTVASVSALWRRPVGWARPTRSTVGPILGYARHVLVASIAWATYTSADLMVAGRELGPALAGAYSLAWTIANLPTERLLNVVTAVTRGAFAAVRDSAGDTRRYLLAMVEGIGLVLFVPLIGLLLVADSAVPLALGARWANAVAPMRLLVVASCFMAIGIVASQVLTARGEARYNARIAIVTTGLLVPGFVLGARVAGATGIACAWCVISPIVTAFRLQRALEDTHATWRDIMIRLRPGVIACAAMAVVLVSLDVAWPPAPTPTWARLLAEISLGAATAGIVIARTNSPLVAAALTLVRSRLPSRASK
jgi:O-antigen/teichoic acid export membrane protein